METRTTAKVTVDEVELTWRDSRIHEMSIIFVVVIRLDLQTGMLSVDLDASYIFLVINWLKQHDAQYMRKLLSKTRL